MRDLSTARDGWREREQIETDIIRSMTESEGIREFDALYREFKPMLDETEPLEREQRNQHLRALQERLARLADWLRRKQLGQSV